MTRIVNQRWIIRVWRTELGPGPYESTDIIELGHQIYAKDSYEKIAERLEKIERLAAYEILSQYTGCGGIVYPDWS